jgi:hypothetical protein
LLLHFFWTAVAGAARRRFDRNNLRSPINSSGIPQNYPVRLVDLTFRREAEQRKAVWRCASHRTPKTLPLSLELITHILQLLGS